MPRYAFLVFVLVGALLAGCASAPVKTASSASASNNTAPSAAPLAATNLTPTLNTTTWALSFDGDIPQYAQACAYSPVAGKCAGAPPTADFSKISTSSFPGTPVSGVVNATWTSAGPSEDSLTLAAFAMDESGGHFKLAGFKTGASPLTIELAKIEVPNGTKFFVGLFPTQQFTPSAPAGAFEESNAMEQPYKLTGTFQIRMT